MLLIEFTGLPNSGKSFFRGKLKQYFENKNFQVYNYKELILFYAYNYQSLKIIEKTKLIFLIFLQFDFIKKIKNLFLKTNNFIIQEENKIKFLRKNSNGKVLNFFIKIIDLNFFYQKLCKSLFIKYKLINPSFCTFFMNEINNCPISFNSKQKLEAWLIEMFASAYICRKLNLRRKICITSEGAIQRLFLLVLFNKKKRKKILKKFTNKSNPIDYIIQVEASARKIHTRNKYRKIVKNGFIFKNFKSIKSYEKEFNFIINSLKKRKKIIKIKNNKDFISKINIIQKSIIT